MSRYPILIDTNIIIDFLRGRNEAISFFRAIKSETNLLISSITIAELYAGIKDKREEKILRLYLEHYSAIAVNYNLAKEAGLLKKKYGPSHGVGIADAVIAATALEQKATLITLNLKHFPMVKSKEAPY